MIGHLSMPHIYAVVKRTHKKDERERERRGEREERNEWESASETSLLPISLFPPNDHLSKQKEKESRRGKE
jgi:hypothetical protein